MDPLTLREQRRKAILRAQEINDAAEKGGRDLTAEEDANWKAAMAEADTLRTRIEREERMAAETADLAKSLGRVPDPGDTGPKGKPSAEDAQRAEFRSWIIGDRPTTAYARFHGTVAENGEIRALQADVDISGGYTVVPQQFIADLIQAVDNAVFIRGFATKYRVERAQSLGVPVLEANPADATWTSEIGTVSEDSTMSFAKRELEPHATAKLLKVSNKMLRASAINAEALVRDRLAYKFAVTEEQAFLTGSGAQRPLGLFTASDDGISTGRDVSTGNTTTYPTFDGLKTAKYTLKGQYWARTRWIMHRDVALSLAKLKDGDGRYIWVDSVTGNEPDRLLNFPVDLSEYAPNTLTTGLYVAILGDLSFYWIADGLDFTLQRLVELYAATFQTGFIARLEVDGAPVLEEAFVRVKLS